MILLYPAFLWLLIPLILLYAKSSKRIVVRTHIFILMLLVLALSRPVLKTSLKKSHIQSRDLIVAVDVSYSMRATDILPSRYDFAKKTIKALLKNNPTDNIMLMAFTSNPLLLSPPTTDHVLIATALESLNPAFILTKGTSLKKLFKQLVHMQQRHKTLLLITDGGEEHDARSLAKLLRQADISLLTLAVGTTQGTTVATKTNGLLKDKEGNLVITRINPMLEELTNLMQGSYLSAKSSPAQTADALHQILDKNSQIQMIQKMQYRYVELYPIPLLIAALLFLLLHTRGLKYLLMLFALLGIPANAGFFDLYHLHKAYHAYAHQDYNSSYDALTQIQIPSIQSQMALANVLYKQQKYKKALNIYTHILTRSSKVKQDIYYNIANTYAHLGQYGKAKTYYTKALQLGKDKEAMQNLKTILFLLDKQLQNQGMSQPTSQQANSSKSLSEEETDEHSQETQSSAGSGAGGEGKNKKSTQKTKLRLDKKASKHPLSSKVYELINKGYIHETHPW